MRLKIVVPDGSMEEKTRDLFAKAGLPIITEGGNRTGEGRVNAQWIEKVVFQPSQDIPGIFMANYFDIAIIGEDWLANWSCTPPILLAMAIGRAGNHAVKLVLAVLNENPAEKPEDLPRGAIVATEYVDLARQYFSGIDRGDIRIMPSSGKTESKIRYGAVAIIDVTESGNSIKKNGLKVIGTIMESNLVITANQASYDDPVKRAKIKWFTRLMRGAYIAECYMSVTANVPEKLLDQAAEIIGGLKGPTCAPLRTKGWYSLSSIVPKGEWDKISYRLLDIGVDDIIPTWDIPCVMRS